MKKLSNSEAELKKSIAYKKKRVISFLYTSKYENWILVGDFNVEINETYIQFFLSHMD